MPLNEQQPLRQVEPLPNYSRLEERAFEEITVWGSYTLNLTLEALLALDAPLGRKAGLACVRQIKQERGEAPGARIAFEKQPFVCLEIPLAWTTGDARLLDALAGETRRLLSTVPRSPDGLMLHVCEDGVGRVLVDRIQDYSVRCVVSGVHMGNADLIEEGVRQWLLHADVLRRLEDGLWSQGRGWIPGQPQALSPGAWSRGQAWVVRGLSYCLRALEPGTRQSRLLQTLLNELLEALMRVQARSGHWHRLPHLAADESLPDSSATGMILHYGYEALKRGFVDKEADWSQALNRASKALSTAVDERGGVLHSCPGPGPLSSEEPYAGPNAIDPVDEPHGRPALLLAAATLAEIKNGRPPVKPAWP